MQDFEELEHRVARNEERLVENRLKFLLRDLFSQLWGKVFVIVMALVIAYVVSNWWSDAAQLWSP